MRRSQNDKTINTKVSVFIPVRLSTNNADSVPVLFRNLYITFIIILIIVKNYQKKKSYTLWLMAISRAGEAWLGLEIYIEKTPYIEGGGKTYFCKITQKNNTYILKLLCSEGNKVLLGFSYTTSFSVYGSHHSQQ